MDARHKYFCDKYAHHGNLIILSPEQGQMKYRMFHVTSQKKLGRVGRHILLRTLYRIHRPSWGFGNKGNGYLFQRNKRSKFKGNC